jgi:hypothetical protein
VKRTTKAKLVVLSLAAFSIDRNMSTDRNGRKKIRPEPRDLGSGRIHDKDSGDNRLSRQRHYHRPGGLNGRVRDGNGCDPASMVAGNVPGRRSSTAGHWISDSWSYTKPQTVKRMSGLLHDRVSNSLTVGHADRWWLLIAGSFKKPATMAAP